MSVFALLHGGWHGAWAWDLVRPELDARGHRTVAVDLPAGDPEAGAAEHAAAVTAALAGAGPDVVLVAHSLAGLCAPLVAAAIPVRHVVYLAAMLPEPGRSVDERARAGERQTRRGLGRGQDVHPDGSTSWQPDAAVRTMFPDSAPALARWAAGRLRRQHWRITAEPSPLRTWPGGPATYVRCAEDQVIDADWVARAVPALVGEPVRLAGDHSPFLARPVELADLLAAV